MSEKELMIGDLLYGQPNDKIVKVVELKEDEIVCNQRCYDLRPIPITPEILEKNGFYDYTVCHCKTNYSIELRGEGASSERWLEYCFTTKSIQLDQTTHFTNQYGEPDEYSKHPLSLEDICYVHELQHALKLCKIEKEIKL